MIARRRWLVLPGLILGVGACKPEVPREGTSFSAISQSCPSRPGGSRWASAAGRYEATATYGRSPEQWLHEAGGVVYRESLLYVYDVPESRILVLTPELIPVHSFGRKGSGPGDLSPSITFGLKGAAWRWIDVAGDTVAVFDGMRLQLFSRDGRFREQRLSRLVGTQALSDGIARIAYAGDGIVGSSGGYDAPYLQRPADRYRWDLTVHGPRTSRRVLSLALAPLPARGRSVPFRGPEQALPLWDLAGGCIAATDGTGAWLVRSSLGGAGVDTIALALPAVKPPRIDRDEIARLIGMASKGQGGYLAPTAVRKLSGLVIDPDGYVWLLPTQDSTHVRGGVEVVRIALSTGAAERDTVPAFPTAFGEPGVYYALTNDRHSGEATVTRYDRAPSANR